MPVKERIRKHIDRGGDAPVLSTDDCLEVLNDIASDSLLAEAMSEDQRHGLNLVISLLSRRGLK